MRATLSASVVGGSVAISTARIALSRSFWSYDSAVRDSLRRAPMS